MMEKMKFKFKSCLGETIGETLVALLISALALMMLAGAVGSAAKIVTRNKAAMEVYYVGGDGSASQQANAFTKWQGKAVASLP